MVQQVSQTIARNMRRALETYRSHHMVHPTTGTKKHDHDPTSTEELAARQAIITVNIADHHAFEMRTGVVITGKSRNPSRELIVLPQCGISVGTGKAISMEPMTDGRECLTSWACASRQGCPWDYFHCYR
jgi:hypothetical protein